MLWTALPRADLFQFEEPGPDIRVEGGALEPFGAGQAGRVDRPEAARKPAKVTDLSLDPLPAHVLEKIVVQVDAVERRVGGLNLVQVRQVFVDEVRQWFG